MADLIKPEQLRKATNAKELERAHQIAEADRRRDEERKHLQEAFMNQQIAPDGMARLRAALLRAAEHGDNQLQVFTFPSELCTDGFRAINNGDPNWPTTLVGFAQRAYQFYKTELQLLRDITGLPTREINDLGAKSIPMHHAGGKAVVSVSRAA